MKIFLIFISIITFTISSVLIAKEPHKPSKAVLAQYQRAMERTIDIALDKMKPHMTSSQRRMLRKIDIKVSKRNWNIYGIHALRNGSDRSITFPLGFGIAVHPIDEAIAFTQLNGGSWDDVMDYMKYYVDAMRENMRRYQKNKPMIWVDSFSHYAGYSEAQYNNTVRRKGYQYILEEIKLHGYALILAHELAHHFYGHLNNSTSSLDEEMEADEEAIKLALASDYNPVLGFTAFLFYAVFENDSGIYDGSATHPPPICRVSLMVIEGTKALKKDRKYMSHLNETGQYTAWTKAMDELVDVLTESADCPNI